MQLILLIGVQGAGKSTFAKQYFADTHLRLNFDMLKTKHRETLLFNACLESKTPTVIDRTNPTQADRATYVTLAKHNHFEVIAYYFDVSFEDALARNNQRTGKAKVPEVGLKSVMKQLEPPSFDEGFDSIYHVRVTHNQFETYEV